MKRYLLYILSACLLISCNEWLDVKSETEAKEEDLFARENGFKSALTGIYMSLADRAIYGESLTMSDVEELACLWYIDDFDQYPGYYYLHKHDYANDYAKSNVQAIYQQMFNTITQTNVLLKNLDSHDEAIRANKRLKDVIQGEAYAIRALCQFDVLRLFGQLPAGKGSREVKLPYSFTTAINDVPRYYAYDEYVQLMLKDINQALTLLKASDPALDYSFNELNYASRVSLEDDFYLYRRTRLNYWAVLALKARMDLYLGNEDQAHAEALEVINATTTGGSAVASLNADSNLDNGYYTLPSEQLFALSKYNVFGYTNSMMIGKGSVQVVPNKHLVVSQEMLAEMFKGSDISANNRYLKLWNKTATTSQGLVFPCLSKYYYNDGDGSPSMIYQTLIPMLRLSEMYLIAMETAHDLSLANNLYYTYMRDHKVITEEQQFGSLDEVRDEVLKEYRREFIAEGQVFFTYKRLFLKEMPWADADDQISESDYIVPLPDTEYEN